MVSPGLLAATASASVPNCRGQQAGQRERQHEAGAAACGTARLHGRSAAQRSSQHALLACLSPILSCTPVGGTSAVSRRPPQQARCAQGHPVRQRRVRAQAAAGAAAHAAACDAAVARPVRRLRLEARHASHTAKCGDLVPGRGSAAGEGREGRGWLVGKASLAAHRQPDRHLSIQLRRQRQHRCRQSAASSPQTRKH